jgi:protein gp37
MSKTNIPWASDVWNPITGCTPISEGCTRCYAATMAKRLQAAGVKGYEDGFKVTLHPDRMDQLRSWRKPRRVFVVSMGDLFHESVPDGWIMWVWWQIIHASPRQKHTFFILTKRPERMRSWMRRWADTTEDDYEPKLARGPEATRAAHKSGRAHLFADMLEAWGEPPNGRTYPTYDWMNGPIHWPTTFDNVWLGVTAENQLRADERIQILLDTPAAHRFVSVEPLLGEIDLNWYLIDWGADGKVLDWVIAGGESGPGHRPMQESWALWLMDQCSDKGVPFHFKQHSGPRPGWKPELDGELHRWVPPLPGEVTQP